MADTSFRPVQCSSKITICPLPIRCDSYRTCTFGCRYCFSNNRTCQGAAKDFQRASVPKLERFLDKVYSGNEVGEGEKLLGKLILGGITWHFGGMSDPFQPAEEKYKATEEVVDALNKRNISVLFSTKSDKTYGVNIRPDLHSFQLSVSNVNNNKLVEPNVPDIQKRFDFFKALKKEGFKVGIRIQPFIPDISTLDIVKMFEGADHFIMEGLKFLNTDKETIKMIEAIGGNPDDYTDGGGGVSLIKPSKRLALYRPFVEYYEAKGISFSCSDNDLRRLGNNNCCCGDNLVKHYTKFNTTYMIKNCKEVCLEEYEKELDAFGVSECKAPTAFHTKENPVGTIKNFYRYAYRQKGHPLCPYYQIADDSNQLELF